MHQFVQCHYCLQNFLVGEGKEDRVVRKFGLGKRNDRGERLLEFCKSQNLVITNTWFEQEKRRRYTRKSPGDLRRYQIDYILVRQRYRNSVKSSWSYPGADGCRLGPQPSGYAVE